MDPDRPIVRWSLMVLWAFVGLMLYEPVLALFGWPLLLLAFAGGVVWTAQDFLALRHQTEPLRVARRRVVAELVILGLVAGVCVVAANLPAIHIDGHAYPLSRWVAPVFMAILLVATLQAIRLPTPRRIAIVSLIALAEVPILATIRILSVSIVVDVHELRIVSPGAITAYSVCSLAIGALGIHLGIVARRHGYGDDIPAPPPTATLQR